MDKKWQWLIIIEESSRDKRELKKNKFDQRNFLIKFYFSKLIRTVRSDCVKWINGNNVINWHVFERFFSLSNVVKRFEIDGTVIFNIPRVVPDTTELVRWEENSGCWWVKLNKGNWNMVELSNSLWVFDRKSWHDAK